MPILCNLSNPNPVKAYPMNDQVLKPLLYDPDIPDGVTSVFR